MQNPTSELEQKKQELQAELDNLKKELDESFEAVSEGVTKSLEPVEIIKKHPLLALGTSALVGFMLSYRRKPTNISQNSNSLFSGIKREFSARLIDLALKKLEDSIKKEDS